MTALRSLLTGSLLIAILAGCSGGSSESATAPPDADLTVTCKGNAFEDGTITLAPEPLFVGEVITNGTIIYEIPALEPGEYLFRCDVHPAMAGIVLVAG